MVSGNYNLNHQYGKLTNVSSTPGNKSIVNIINVIFRYLFKVNCVQYNNTFNLMTSSLAFPIKVNYLADLLRKASLSIEVHMGFHYNISHSWLKNIKTNFIQSYRLKREALLCPSFDFIFLVDFNKSLVDGYVCFCQFWVW